MPTAVAENYLKQLYYRQQAASGELVRVGDLAAAMGVTPGTATTMVKSLARSGWAVYEPRTGVRLTRRGERLALSVVRRHRLLELFLSKVLGLDWSEVHAEAEVLEHAVSEKVVEKIDALLGRPQVDPHGDPIPTASGTLPKPPATTLADCPVDRPVHIVRIVGADQDRDFLHFLDRKRHHTRCHGHGAPAPPGGSGDTDRRKGACPHCFRCDGGKTNSGESENGVAEQLTH